MCVVCVCECSGKGRDGGVAKLKSGVGREEREEKRWREWKERKSAQKKVNEKRGRCEPIHG